MCGYLRYVGDPNVAKPLKSIIPHSCIDSTHLQLTFYSIYSGKIAYNVGIWYRVKSSSPSPPAIREKENQSLKISYM